MCMCWPEKTLPSKVEGVLGFFPAGCGHLVFPYLEMDDFCEWLMLLDAKVGFTRICVQNAHSRQSFCVMLSRGIEKGIHHEI